MDNLNREIISKMQRIYGTYEYDWMGCPITEKNPLTFHHLVEKRNDGKVCISNGALLTKSSHRKLNIIESKDKDLYNEWQWLFNAINEEYSKPSYAYTEMMEELLTLTNNIIYNKNDSISRKKVVIFDN